ncbi:MAG: thioester dehydrase [Colwellia sp.]|nr:thioester dehydrase [Colwellia sp.]MCW8864262.1 thioester dehydrase [Colwellia sp.]MCW9082401.1 thioester dehydrase [Colwellia sp.]
MNNHAEAFLPAINAIEQQNDKALINLTINADLRCFKGHFDDAAVVPGVVQLDWAIAFARKYLSLQGDVLDVSVLKFQKLLLPNMTVQLEIVKKSANKFTFSYFCAEDKFSSARVELI